MTKATKAKPLMQAKASDPAAPTPLELTVTPGETNREVAGRKIVAPFTRHAFTSGEMLHRLTDSMKADRPGPLEYAKALKAISDQVAGGDLGGASEMLMAQAATLDIIFAEYARLAAINTVNHLDAAERLLRLALKAQASSRATIAELVKLHQPREQTVRHVHVNEGGQAIVADQLHQHTGGQKNEESADQPHATGARKASASAQMLGDHAQGNGVPVSCDQGREAVQNARRERKRCAEGQ